MKRTEQNRPEEQNKTNKNVVNETKKKKKNKCSSCYCCCHETASIYYRTIVANPETAVKIH